jgi:hypothetical protein
MAKQKYTIQHLGKGYMHYISLDEATIAKFAPNEKRLLCTIGSLVIHCAMLKRNDIGYYIMLSKANLQKINAKLGDEIIASFKKDTTPLQFTDCEVLTEVLETDSESKTVWETLTQGNKRSIVYWILNIKNTDKQIERALLVSEKLKLGITNIKEIIKKN